jgi:hypothetical protein
MAKRSTAITVSQILSSVCERNERERMLLRALARGEREIALGRGFSLDRVLADADKVLTRRRG